MSIKTYIINISSILALSLMLSFPLRAAVDDHGNTYQTATPVTIDTETSGNIETYGDVDYFRFSAGDKITYTITVTLESLVDSWLILYNTDGVTQIMFNDDNSDALSSKIEWACPESGTGTYYISVAGYDYYNTGRYSVLITAKEISDDEGCFIATAGYGDARSAKWLNGIINFMKSNNFYWGGCKK